MADDAVTEFKVTYHDSPRAGRLAVVTMDNGHDHTKPTTFGEAALRSLDAALSDIEQQTDVKGLLLTGKPFVFAVGADLDSFADVTTDLARQAGQAGHAAFTRLSELPYPTVAAINGAAMGGGLEIALHCDYRTLSKAATALAFPEVFLSILPGWGGTQLAPRLMGVENALQVIVHNALNQNKMLRPAEAFELGLADRLLEPVDFLEQSLAFLEDVVTGEVTVERGAPDTAGLDDALAAARAFADDKTHGATPAPYRAIDCIEFAARDGELAEGRQREIDGLAELLPSRQAQASVYSFHLVQQRVKKQPWKPAARPRGVAKVAVVGSGLMGAQLGALLLQRYQVPLVMKDIDQAVLDSARAHIEGELDKRVQRGRLDAGKAVWLKSVVTYTVDYEPLAGADFVIEAVVEVLNLKKQIFAEVEAVVEDGAVLASNTSSLSVGDMAADLAHPERVVGFHFFNPVVVMPLVEVVRTEQASDEAMATAFEVAKTLRKSAVGCADTPAFIVNRLLVRFMGAAGAATNRGNDFAEVDDAIKALGVPMGPFELMGLVGLPVNAHVARIMHEAYPDRFPLDDNVQMLGELDLPGVYDWSKGRVPYDEIRDRWSVDPAATPLSAEEIRAEALEAVADEAKHMLDEGAVADARDIDTGMLLGAGFPFFMGGICRYLDQIGLSDKLFGAPLLGEADAAFA